MTITREAPLAPVPGAAHAGPPRVALYSHDALGLGHIRRNLALAHALAGSAEAPDILLLTSAPEVVAGDRPDRCDVVALPGVAKSADGTYTSRHLSLDRGHLGRMREGILSAALDAFRPDVLIVDKHPRACFTVRGPQSVNDAVVDIRCSASGRAASSSPRSRCSPRTGRGSCSAFETCSTIHS